ncbi:MAG: hypothetical protein GVY25_02270 [Bacteroidetes bacterium]|jgi:hypothetical protein|nr:hypothetical protein [Bacteroidota bacterium]
MKQAAEDASRALEDAQSAANSEEAGERMGQAFQKLRETAGGGTVVQAIDFRKLKPVLPGTLDGMQTGDVTGSRSSQMGMSTSKAEAVYRADGERRERITVTVTDMGSMSGLTSLSSRVSAWTESETESTTGYDRGTTIAGYDGRETFRSYETGGSTGRLQFLVADRFQVEVDGRNVPMDRLKAAGEAVDIDALTAMKDEGVGVDDGKQQEVADMYAEFREAEERKQAAPGDTSPEPIAPVEAAELKALLPTTLAGLDRAEIRSQKQPMAENRSLLRAAATYTGGDKRLSVEVIDYAQILTPGGVLPGAAWMMYDVEKESESGYERTTEIQGYPAKETMRTRDTSIRSDVQMVVEGRFYLKVEGRNLTMEEVKAAIADVGPARIADLARRGA